MNFRLKLSAATLFTAATMIASPSVSRADVIQTFDLSGQFVYPTRSGYANLNTLGGTVTIDTTTGSVVSQTSFPALSPQLPVTITQGYSSTAKAYQLHLFGTIFVVDLYFNTPSLVNYAGGNLASLATPTSTGTVSTYDGQLAPSGIVLSYGTAKLEPVPEPGSMPLVVAGLGCLALAGVFRRGRL